MKLFLEVLHNTEGHARDVLYPTSREEADELIVSVKDDDLTHAFELLDDTRVTLEYGFVDVNGDWHHHIYKES